ncbi:efflux RND transporter periplasmic adaptor subunit [Haliscomenobacter sp.]|uniref:HlyD family secretion protein n=1 Tax=Haliscomenobacter sp. TaxID=2717303 RepID=UPI0033652CFC
MAKKKSNNWLIIGLIALLAVLVVVAVIQARNKPKGEKVTAEKAELRTIKEVVAASGKVFPHTEVKISSDVSGEIVELYVKEGDSVRLGQVLARIDADVYQSQVEQGMAALNQVKAQEANAKAQIESQRGQREQILANLENAREIQKRNEKLFKNGVISEADYQTSLSSMRALEANLKASEASIKSSQESAKGAAFQIQSSEASLKQLRTSLKRTTIYSPNNGIVSKLNVEKGERVVGTIQMTGTEMMRIANLNNMEVRVDVSENDIPRVKLGDAVDVEVDAYIGRKFLGHVTEIANSSSNSATAALTSDQITNFEVRIAIDPSSYQDLIEPRKRYPFRPGMSASVEINTTTKANVLTIPIQSVTTREKDASKTKSKVVKNNDGEEELVKDLNEDDLKEVVFIIGKGDTIKMAEIKTGVQDDSYIEVLEGIKAGDVVVSGPYSTVARKLKAGNVVRKVKEDELFSDGKKKKTEDQ